ncbi:MAG TPA: universal stress protein, partial [Actinomycetota bacterium]
MLLATDGRPSASAAAGLLTRLADPERIEVAILSAPDPRVETPDHYVQELLDATGHVLTEAGLSCRSIRRDEEPASAVEKEATGDTYGVVVLGAGNHTWGGEIVLGSVTSHVLRTVPVPILLVHRRPHRPGDPLRVLVGADGSPAASHAIDTLMRLTEPARVDISVRTVTRAPEMVIRGHASVGGGAAMATPEGEVDLAAARLERALERLRAEGFHPRGSIGLGWPA